MKQSSSEPPKKKLKQARLPFQILSPPVVKNCDASPPSQCKRKACETASDDDVVVSEINENKITPLEKKSKVIHKDNDVETSNSEDACMEVDEVERGMKVPATKQNRQNSTNSGKKTRKINSSHKSNRKNKTHENRNEKTDIKNSNNKSEVVDFVDLCDSPAKSNKEDGESTPDSLPKYTGETLDSGIKKTLSKDDSDSKSSVVCPVSKEDVLYSKTSEKKDSTQLKEPSTVPSNIPSDELENISSHEEYKEKGKSDLQHDEKEEVTKEMSCSKDDKSPELKCRSGISKQKTPSVKMSMKQPSIKYLVTSKSPKTDSTEGVNKANKDNSDDKSNDINEKSQNLDSNKSTTHSIDVSPPKHSPESILDESDFKTPSKANDSLITNNSSSPSSECNTSSLSTPGSVPNKTPKTARRKTPKQLLILEEKEKKRKERERLKEEKDKKKAEEKEEKLKLKKEKEEERLRLKQEKEDEKRKEREEKEKKKQAELEQKNEEKRLKEEEKRQKEEEKRAKEEEKRKKEDDERKKKEEKRLKEEQKEAEKRKSAQAFVSFFVKTETKAFGAEEDNEYTPIESNFQPFEVKNDMRLAPLLRSQMTEEHRQLLNSVLERSIDDVPGKRLYLEQIRSPSYVCGTASRTWPPPDETDDEVIIIESEKPNEEMEIDERETEKKPEKRHRRAKLLQFHENRRPPYWGTWRKKSKYIRPRAPLNQDKTMLEYEIDSDDEWEEPEDGESLRGSEDDESQDEQYEEDNDMFVPHGYLSDGEGEDELDDQSPETMKARLKLLQMEFEAERNEKQQKLKPRLIGCVWFCNYESSPSNVGSQIAELFLLRRAVWEGSLPVKVAAPLPSPTVTNNIAETPGTKKKLVKETMVPDILKKIHGSRKKLSKLLVELIEDWRKDKTESLPSKNCMAKKIRELASWDRPTGTVHHCWYVKEDVRRAYGLTDLELPQSSSPTTPTHSPAANITKFTKVLTTDERLKLLRDSPAGSKEVPKEPSNTVPSTPTQNMKASNQSTKTPTVKLGSPNPVVKKRIPLITIGLKESPKQNTSTSIMNFVTKSAKCDETKMTQKEVTAKAEEEVKKRITPITLSSTIAKPTPPPPSSNDDCIILDD